jgi:3-hydroxybutyryl-CoA dehydrogenase
MNVRTIGVIGAGALGRGIACAVAASGYRVVLEDISSQALAEGLGAIKQMLMEYAASGDIRAQQSDSALANVATAHSVQDACRMADLLIEAVAEEMEMKLELFTIFDKFAKPGAIFASSTGSLSIAEIAAMTFCAENCVGMRFVDPVQKMKRLEIVRAPETSDATVNTCVEVGRRMGKDVIVVREARQPGRM